MHSASHILIEVTVLGLVPYSAPIASTQVKEGAWDMQQSGWVRTGAEPYKIIQQDTRRECLSSADLERITVRGPDMRKVERDFGTCPPPSLERGPTGEVSSWTTSCIAPDGTKTDIGAINTFEDERLTLLFESTTKYTYRSEVTDVLMLIHYQYIGECPKKSPSR